MFVNGEIEPMPHSAGILLGRYGGILAKRSNCEGQDCSLGHSSAPEADPCCLPPSVRTSSRRTATSMKAPLATLIRTPSHGPALPELGSDGRRRGSFPGHGPLAHIFRCNARKKTGLGAITVPIENDRPQSQLSVQRHETYLP